MKGFVTDEHIRPTSLEDMAKLQPTFDKDGVQTAANSSGIVDGAAAAVVAGADHVQARKLQPLARIVASTTSGVDPRTMGLGPVPAIRLLLELTGLSLKTSACSRSTKPSLRSSSVASANWDLTVRSATSTVVPSHWAIHWPPPACACR